jgi:hypothetical protein
MLNRIQTIFGALLTALGALWSMQGAGWVHFKPILCFADCVEVRDATTHWLLTGLAAIASGASLCYLTRRRKRNARSDSKPP